VVLLWQVVKKHGTVDHPTFGKIYAYETNGFGSYLLMDDGNVPSLLSLPFIGFLDSSDVVYQNTRKYILSNENPYFFKGSCGEGIGSPHTGPDMIWPIGVAVRALTTNSDSEIIYCLSILKNASLGTGFMHESFYKDNYNSYTRSWFAWANSLLGQLILRLAKVKPHLRESLFSVYSFFIF